MFGRAFWPWLAVLALGGCAGESLESPDGGSGQPTLPEPGVDGSPSFDAGAAEASAPNEGGACGPVDLTDHPPGQAIGNVQTPGAGECARSTLDDVIAAVHAARPDLWDIVELYDPAGPYAGDGNFIYAWQRADGGFALAFVRGWGDCPAGCIEHEYFYFETGAGCAPVDLGRYHASYEQSDGGYCVVEGGQPRWDKPPAVGPSYLCGADMSPQDISGTTIVYAEGQRIDCDETTKTQMSEVQGCLQLIIQQDPANLASGTVQLVGTGHPAFDAPLAATFERRSFSVWVDEQTPGGCAPQARSVDLRFDLEAMQGAVHAQDVVPLASCDYCKFDLGLTLTLANQP